MTVSEATKKLYKPTIGIECHVQLKTKTKLFSGAGNDARQAKPNTLISHIDTGMPGALPVLNEKALELASRAAFALNTKPQEHSYFERKHYFYPDSPAGYQISQLQSPIIVGGSVAIQTGNDSKTVRINRAQLEADAGKTTHPAGADYSLVDLNRSGTPLLEIVSEPDIHSPADAKSYARELYLLMKYADVSDVDLYHGNMRFDVNVSVSKHPTKLGKRSEVKNLNSFRSVENAVEYEINRQIELNEAGEQVVQETRGWDEDQQKTSPQRGKEEAHDYRYMPEPDIPPIRLNDDYINKVAANMPRLPGEWRKILNKLSISSENQETLLEAEAENENISYLSAIEEAMKDNPEAARQTANLMVNIEIPLMREKTLESANPIEKWSKIYQPVIKLINSDKLNSNHAKKLLIDLLMSDDRPPDVEKYAAEKDYIQVSDESAIDAIVAEVINENPKAVEDVKNGEAKAIGFLVGQVMAKSQGQANPQIAQQTIKKQIGL